MSFNRNLARGLRKRHVPVVEIAGWSRRGHGPMGDVKGIVLHHTAGPRTGNIPSLRVLVKGRPGLSGPLCNLGYGRDGKAYVVAGGLAYHAGKPDPAYSTGVRRTHTSAGNSHLIGIEMESSGHGDWSAAQRRNLVPLLAALCREYNLSPSTIIAHREWAPNRKPDPVGIEMDDLRAKVARELDAPRVDYGRPATKAEILKCRLTGKLVPDGVLGVRTVRALQRAAGIPLHKRTARVDGQLWLALDDALNGDGGRPAVIRALRKRVGVSPLPSTLDKRAVRAIQRYLNRHRKF